MKLTPDDYAASMSASLDVYDALRPRSMQTDLGVSSIGDCRSEALWRLTGVQPTDAPTGRQALFGTAAHEMIAAARKQFVPGILVETELSITLPSGQVVVGHCDEIDPGEPSVTDWKTVADSADIVALRRTGCSEQQRFQRHLYALGAIQAGLVPEQGLTVRNVWVDRAGQTNEPYVEQEPFSMAVVEAADSWLSDVLYAREHGEEVTQDHHYDWCRRFCEFFTHCRAGQAHADAHVTDPELIQAAVLHAEGRDLRKKGEALEKAGRRILEPLQATAHEDVAAFLIGAHRVRWSRVNSTTGGHWKLTSDPVSV